MSTLPSRHTLGIRGLWLGSCVLLTACSRTPSNPPPSQEASSDATPAAPNSNAPSAPWFEEVAQDRGLVFDHFSALSDQYLLPENVPGGAALFDMDNDGDLDAYFVQSGDVLDDPDDRPANQLFENLGDGSFRNVTEDSGTDDHGYGMGVACGDYDNDGDVDLYVTNYGPNVLYRNEGGGVFTDVTEPSGTGHAEWGASATFFDFDRDGDLDLFITNYLRWTPQVEIKCFNTMGSRDYCGPQNYNLPSPDVLYRNEGDGTFTDVSEASGIASSFGNGLGVLASDFNGDGWLDLFVANDKTEDHLWINQQDGTFLERALILGCAVDQEGIAKSGMGVTAADLDDDGDIDLMVCNLATESDSLFRNEGAYFVDATLQTGHSATSRHFTRFGMGWFDLDNDGWLDLYQANGRVSRQERSYTDDPYAEPNLLFRGDADHRFSEVEPRGGTAELLSFNSRAAVFGDVDNDGATDILLTNLMDRAQLLRNVAPNRGHWITLRVLEEHGRDAYNAIVSVAIGPRTLTREVRADSSYLASIDPRLHIGLGEATSARDVIVQWIDGARESFGDLEGDRFVTLRRGEGRAVD